MRTARANRLARRAFRLRANGSRGPIARLAWRTLTTAAERHDQNAVTAMRTAWLRDPRDDTWQEVGRWYPLPEVLAAAVSPDRSAASRAALGAFCLRHDQVPDNEVARALFFVLTGHHERYEALDPDGTLLAGGYRGAPDATREVLRHTMLELGEVNLVRVIADRPDRSLTESEADYLAGQLADAADWHGLWRLVPTIPLVAAVRAARLFGDWRPPDDPGQAFLARLAATGPEVGSAAAAAVATRLDVRHPRQFSFAPGGSELAVRAPKGTTVHDPRTGRQLAGYPDRGQREMLALGNGVIVCRCVHRDTWPVVRCAPERPHEVLVPDNLHATISGIPGGFLMSHNATLSFGAASGPWSRVEIVGEEHLGAGRRTDGVMASDPASGHIAMYTGRTGTDAELVLLDAELTMLARGPRIGHDDGVFCGPELLLVWRFGMGRAIESWQRDGTDLARIARIDLDGIHMQPVPLPARNLVAVRLRRDRLTWLDAHTLTEVDGPAGLPTKDVQYVAFSPDGSLAAVAANGDAEVYDLRLCQLAALTNRSVARLTLTDLETVETQATRTLTPPLTEAVELLRAGLAYRFGADVALGTWVADGADDIALGGG